MYGGDNAVRLLPEVGSFFLFQSHKSSIIVVIIINFIRKFFKTIAFCFTSEGATDNILINMIDMIYLAPDTCSK